MIGKVSALPFKLQKLEIHPALHEVRSAKGTIRLEPKTMRLLCVLAEAGRVVSREELIRQVWDNRVVSDDAVTRQLGKLRHALGDDVKPPELIQTIPKVGVRLLVEPVPLKRERKDHNRMIVLATLCLAVLAAGWWFTRTLKVAPVLSTPLTSAQGIETHAAVSYDQRLAYVAKVDGFFAVHIKPLNGGLGKPVTFGTGHAFHPRWSPDGRELAFIHVFEDVCDVRLLNLRKNHTRTLTQCIDAVDGGLDWSPTTRQLALSDRPVPGAPFSVVTIDLDTGKRGLVTTPPADSIGDVQPRYDPGGTSLAFLRVVHFGVEDIYRYRLADQRMQRLTNDSQKIHGFDFDQGGVSLLVSSNRLAGIFSLWRFDLADGQWTQAGTLTNVDAPVTVPGVGVVLEMWTSEVNLWQLPVAKDQAANPLVTSTRWDWSPTLNPQNDRLAFVSDRSGAAELWLANTDGSEPSQLTKFGGPYTQAPAWSPDGSELVTVAPVDGIFQVFLVDSSTGIVHQLTTDNAHKEAPSYADDQTLWVTVLQQDGRRALYKLDITTGERRQVLDDVRLARQKLSDERLLLTRPGIAGLWRFDPKTRELVQIDPHLAPVDYQNWTVDESSIVLVHREADGSPFLVRLDLDSGTYTRLRDTPNLLHKSGLSRGADGSMIVSLIATEQADLVLVSGLAEN